MVRPVAVFLNLIVLLPFNTAVFYDDSNENWRNFALQSMMDGISYAILKKDCNETTELTFSEDQALEIIRKDFQNNDTKIEFLIKGVYDKRFIDMGVTACSVTRDVTLPIENDSESFRFISPSVNVSKIDRIKIHNAGLLSFKNAFNAALIGDPIMFEVNDNITDIKSVAGTVNIKFDEMSLGVEPGGKSSLNYNIERCYVLFRYFTDFEIDEDASITTKSHCSNTGSQTMSLTKFLTEYPDIFSNLHTYHDSIRLENANGTFILKNFQTRQKSESVLEKGYSCCH